MRDVIARPGKASVEIVVPSTEDTPCKQRSITFVADSAHDAVMWCQQIKSALHGVSSHWYPPGKFWLDIALMMDVVYGGTHWRSTLVARSPSRA